ncbi:hypothetical protein ScPMuIL_017996 [Solemya velum]
MCIFNKVFFIFAKDINKVGSKSTKPAIEDYYQPPCLHCTRNLSRTRSGVKHGNMSRLLLSAFLYSLIYTAHCAEFVFPQNDSCIKVDMTATFNLSMTGSTQTDVFSLTDAAVMDSTSNCTGTTHVLVIDLGHADQLKLTFSENEANEVTLDMEYTFNVTARFPDSQDNGTVVLTTESVPLGLSNTSYLCKADLPFTFTDKDKTANMEMVLSESHIQAFNFNGNFSEESECENDKPTTPKPTTPKPTTPKPTTPKPTTPKPTTSKPPSANHYVFDDCIIMNAAITLDVNYTKTDGSEDMVQLTVPAEPSTNVTGTCNANTSHAAMILSFSEGDAKRMVTFEFVVVKDEVFLENVTVMVDLDNTTFPDAKESSMKMDNEVHLHLSHADAAFKCDSEDIDVKTVHVLTTNLEVQAFNLVNSTFSGTVEDCNEGNKTTPAPTTTPKPATTTPMPPPTTTPLPKPPVENYMVSEDGVNCIVLKARLQYDVTYITTDKDKAKTVKINVLNDTEVSGSCNYSKSVQELTIKDKDWEMSFFFHSTGKGLQVTADNTKFYLGNVSFSYTLNDDLFPNAKQKGANFTASKDNMDKSTFEANEGGSYKCNTDRKVDIGGNVTLHITDFQYRAFGKDNSTSVGGNGVTECTDDSKTNSIVPIAVGAALAALVVIVLIAYLIGRRRRNKGYESV